MLQFSGPAGSLYRIADPLPFTAALEDCGDGFDWRVADPSLRFWTIDDEPCFQIWSEQTWWPVLPLEVWPQSGSVSFGRCYQGEHLRVTAVCLPLGLAAETGEWTLEVHTIVKRPNTLGVTTVEGKPGPRVCRFPDVTVTGPVLARLQGWEPDYLFIGMGDTINPTGSGTVLTFDEKGIVYVPA